MADDIKARFESAVARSKTLPSQSTSAQLEMYGLYKQATAGDASGARPGMMDMRGRAKWDAWDKRKGMSPDDAMQAYIDYVAKLG